jgi:lysophospholipase L1-like esterase
MIPGHRPARARLGLAGLLTAVALGLASCGGGTSAYREYAPAQVVVLGDENSAILSDGRRYTVNPLKDGGGIACDTEPLWVQTLAAHYGYVFKECNPADATEFKARMRAVPGAKADEITTQIDAQLADGDFADGTLVTVMLGTNDVLALYAGYPAQSEADINAELRARGQRLGGQINRLIDLGARVIVATMPDLGVSPFGQQQKTDHTDTDRAQLLTRMATAFNTGLRTTILNDGRYIGLVLADEMSQSMNKYYNYYGLTDGSTAVCVAETPPPDCTSDTLVANGSSAAWLWSGDRWLAYGGQLRLGALVLDRATNNPF